MSDPGIQLGDGGCDFWRMVRVRDWIRIRVRVRARVRARVRTRVRTRVRVRVTVRVRVRVLELSPHAGYGMATIAPGQYTLASQCTLASLLARLTEFFSKFCYLILLLLNLVTQWLSVCGRVRVGVRARATRRVRYGVWLG